MPKVIEQEKVFSATVKIFVTHSYETTTIKDIADEAGVNEATLYRKYGTKAGLIEQALEHHLSDTPLDRVTYTGDLKADLVAIVQAHIETHAMHSDILSALLAQAPGQSELRSAMSRPLAHIAGVAGILQQYQDRGLLKTESPLAMVGVLLGPIIIRQMFQRAMRGSLPGLPIDPQEYVDDFLYGKSKPVI